MPGPSPSTDWWAQRAPSASAAVLTTGTLSVGLDLAGYGVLSRIALGVACAAWLMLAADFTLRLLPAGTRWRSYAGVPGLVDTVAAAALTTVAATAVLGTGFSAAGSQALAAALLVLAVLLWPVPLALPAQDGERRRPGTVFTRCMATQGLAVLGATLAAAESAAWLAHAALVLFWLGLVLYVLALARFDVRQVAEGRGDHWLVAGALALSALAGARLISSDSAQLYLWNVDDRGTLSHVTVALLVLTLVCCAVLLAAEFLRPRPRTDIRRWATVFTWAMTATAALAVAAALDVSWLDGLGEVLLWVSVAAWLVVTAWTVASARACAVPGRVRSRARR
ncbi:SLAC1 family transporter [Streptomyces afghaniensis]|uniref:SLAC1 family transporter n=1 Tax=Streptomyces afghaniensis TaxID=66865 RepID=UPI0037A7E62C